MVKYIFNHQNYLIKLYFILVLKYVKILYLHLKKNINIFDNKGQVTIKREKVEDLTISY